MTTTSFQDNYIPEPFSGCWLWTARTLSRGYGQALFNGKVISAHRISWLIHNGIIPNGQCVLHRCDTKICVNPAHLFLGTQKDNYDDAKSKNRHSCGERHGNAKLTAKKVKSIRSDVRTQCKIAAEYGVSQQVISEIKSGCAWKST